METSLRNQLLSRSCAALAWMMASTGVVLAAGTCTDSPESPTVVLGLLGAASAGLPWLRARWSWRRRGTGRRVEPGA